MLPRLLPMLAVPAQPFDSAECSFELKWDGIRALAGRAAMVHPVASDSLRSADSTTTFRERFAISAR